MLFVSALASLGRAGLGAAAYGAGRLTRFAVGAAVNGIAAPTSSVATREAGYQTEALATNNIPDPSQLLDAYWRGRISLGFARDYLAYHGIPFNPAAAEDGNSNTWVWSGVIASTRPTLDTSTVIGLYERSLIDFAECNRRLVRNGLSSNEDRALILTGLGWYDAGTAADLWRQGQITDATYQQALARDGVSQVEAQRLMLTQRTPYDLSQTVTDHYMGWAPPALTDARLARLGYGEPDERKQVLGAQTAWDPQTAATFYYRGLIGQDELRGALGAAGILEARQQTWIDGSRPMPGSQDLISFAVHEVWDQQVVARFGYDEDFPPELSWFMQRQGWGDSEAVPAQGGNPALPSLEWALAYWRAHWRPLAPTQGYEMFHALTPGRVAELQGRIPGLEVFTWADLNAVLKIADYPPKVRAWLAATSYTVMDIRQARQVYALGIRDRAWYIEQLTRRGQTPADAAALVDLEDAKRTAKDAAPMLKLKQRAQQALVKQIIASYSLGTYTRDYALAQLRDAGIPQGIDVALIDGAAASANLAVVKDALGQLRRGFLNGEFAPAELPSLLAGLGLVPEAVQRYAARWTLQRSQHRRLISTDKLLSYVASGRVTPEVARARLINLGWFAPDVLLLIDEARAKHDQLLTRERKAEDMAKGKRQRELEALGKAAAAQSKRVQDRLRRMTPLGDLKKWLVDGIASAEWVRDRLLAMGYDEPVVIARLNEWTHGSPSKSPPGPQILPVGGAPPGATTPEEPLPAPVPTGKIPPPTGAEKLQGGGQTIGQTTQS